MTSRAPDSSSFLSAKLPSSTPAGARLHPSSQAPLRMSFWYRDSESMPLNVSRDSAEFSGIAGARTLLSLASESFLAMLRSQSDAHARIRAATVQCFTSSLGFRTNHSRFQLRLACQQMSKSFATFSSLPNEPIAQMSRDSVGQNATNCAQRYHQSHTEGLLQASNAFFNTST